MRSGLAPNWRQVGSVVMGAIGGGGRFLAPTQVAIGRRI